MKLKDIFLKDPARGIPPVVYFHDQTPEKLASEVGEYIVTGGWPKDHPNNRRVPRGIHEEYVSLLRELRTALDEAPELPAVWISGFYGSGKSSFAKLLGLALDGRKLPDGRRLADALVEQDHAPLAGELRSALDALLARVSPISVVFDIGGVARDNEQIHSAVVRQVQERLGYCPNPAVAEHELALEKDGLWDQFEAVAAGALGVPWSQAREQYLASSAFSQVMHALLPDRYDSPTAWYIAHLGANLRAMSPHEATRAIAEMLKRRAPDRHLYIVVDEVSQYIHQDNQRMLALQSFVSDLGQRLRGRVWLLVTGQEKLDAAGDAVLGKMKDRFPPRFRVHLAATNIRDVVHRRLLQKREEARPVLRALYTRHRDALALFAYGCQQLTEEELIETYPLLPGYIELLGKITSELRRRSNRSQGDDQAIRGLLQLLGELFREGLAERELGALVTLEDVYDVQHTALDSDTQATLSRLLAHCADLPDRALATQAVRVAKAVALLEQIQEELPTTGDLIAATLYDHVDRGPTLEPTLAALEHLRRHNLLGYSEKLGYKIQSTAGEEWDRQRADQGVTRDEVSELLRAGLALLTGELHRPRLQARQFPWDVLFSDDRRHRDTLVQHHREAATITADLRFVPGGPNDHRWVEASASDALRNRLVWVMEDGGPVDTVARELGRSKKMIDRHKGRRESLPRDRQMLLLQEEARAEELERALRGVIEQALLDGQLYFRGQPLDPRSLGATFKDALYVAGERFLSSIYPQFVATNLQPSELAQLLQEHLHGLSPKFMEGELGLFELDAGSYVATCAGLVPKQVCELVERENGVSGHTLLEHFGGPPFGWAAAVTRAALIALLHAKRVTIAPEGRERLTSVRDPGGQDLFTKDTLLRRASVLPAGEDVVGRRARADICRMFKEAFGHDPQRDNESIANAVARLFPPEDKKLKQVRARYAAMLTQTPLLPALQRLEPVLEGCIARARYTEQAVLEVKKHLDLLRDGLQQLAVVSAELTLEAAQAVAELARVQSREGAELEACGGLDEPLVDALATLKARLSAERPWLLLGAERDAAALIRSRYAQARAALQAAHEDQADAVCVVIKARPQFERLSADDAHRVLRPLREAAEAPASASLTDLRLRFPPRLQAAEEEAYNLLDALLQEKEQRTTVRVDLSLRNREVGSLEEIDALAEEIRAALRAAFKAGRRLRVRVP